MLFGPYLCPQFPVVTVSVVPCEDAGVSKVPVGNEPVVMQPLLASRCHAGLKACRRAAGGSCPSKRLTGRSSQNREVSSRVVNQNVLTASQVLCCPSPIMWSGCSEVCWVQRGDSRHGESSIRNAKLVVREWTVS